MKGHGFSFSNLRVSKVRVCVGQGLYKLQERELIMITENFRNARLFWKRAANEHFTSDLVVLDAPLQAHKGTPLPCRGRQSRCYDDD